MGQSKLSVDIQCALNLATFKVKIIYLFNILPLLLLHCYCATTV